eukprot:scaffold110474_cov54-Phaeocystis_antarctica.AAC.1
MGEVVITLPLPPGVRSRALSCTFKRTQLCATLKGAAEPLLNVEVLLSDIRPDGCVWTLLGETLQLSLEKQARHSIQHGALHGAPHIVHRIVPGTYTAPALLHHPIQPIQAPGIFWRCLCEGHTEVTLPSWWPLAV